MWELLLFRTSIIQSNDCSFGTIVKISDVISTPAITHYIGKEKKNVAPRSNSPSAQTFPP